MKRPIVLVVLLILAGCSEKPVDDVVDVALPPEGFRLPVSINDVMVALVNEAADPIWIAAWREPKSDAQWRELERRAYQLKLAGSLIAYAGTGGLDEKWTAKPSWKRWSSQLRDAGAAAIVAVESRDTSSIGEVGDQIVEVCEGCHADFKLPFPTGGKFGQLSPTEDDPDK